MDRRNFLKMIRGAGAGVVATATMAEVGMWAELMDWLQRKPVFSIPAYAGANAGISTGLSYTDIDAITIEYLKKDLVYIDNFYKESVIFERLISRDPMILCNDWPTVNLPFSFSLEASILK